MHWTEGGWLDTLADVGHSSDELKERKKTAAFILATGSFGFVFLGLAALLLSRRYPGSLAGDELAVSGAVGIATGIFLVVAMLAVWFDKGWVGQWHD